ncbi:flagellar basal body-associated protein FliL [Treponema pallidum]|nr:flagellar basal body-associated protein FliL [Treponema pallidum]
MGDIADDFEEQLVAPAADRVGFLPGLLRWVAIAVGAVIFIVTVVTATALVLAKQGSSHTAYPVSQEFRESRELLQYYESVGLIRTNTADALPGTVVVSVALGYPLNDKTAQQELSARLVELKDFLRSYFQRKTLSELRPEHEQKVKIEIRNEINDNVLSRSKVKDIRFTQFDVLKP